MLMWLSGTYLSGMFMKIHPFQYKRMHLEMSAKCWPFCLSFNAFTLNILRSEKISTLVVIALDILQVRDGGFDYNPGELFMPHKNVIVSKQNSSAVTHQCGCRCTFSISYVNPYKQKYFTSIKYKINVDVVFSIKKMLMHLNTINNWLQHKTIF